MPRHMYVFENHPDFSSKREVTYQASKTPRFIVLWFSTVDAMVFTNTPNMLSCS